MDGRSHVIASAVYEIGSWYGDLEMNDVVTRALLIVGRRILT